MAVERQAVRRSLPMSAIVAIALGLSPVLTVHAAKPSANATSNTAARSAEQELWLAVQINHSGPPEPVLLLKLADGRLLAHADDLKRWRLQLPATAATSSSGEIFYALDDLPGLSYRMDEPHQALFIDAPADLFASTVLHGQSRHFSAPQPPPLGAFFNYDISSQASAGHNQIGGLFELAVFNSWGVGTTNFLARNYGSGPYVIRLDTTWTQDRPANLASLRLGDSISAPGDWGRSVRFGGIQWATDFATQPGFVPFPLPKFSGAATLPSTVDLFVDNALRMSREVPVGPFSILDLPVVTGSGIASVVVRDVLGREQLVNLPYYASPRLLQAGLNAFSYEAGFVRDNYALASNDYGRFAAVGTQRHGFTDWLTGEVHAEVLRGQQTAGISGALLLSSIGVFRASAAASHSRELGDGALVELGFERQTGRLSFGGSVQLASPHFTQLGIPRGTLAPRRVSQAYASLATTDFGSFGLSYADQDNRSQDSVQVLGASYSVRAGTLGYLSFSAVHTTNQLSGTTYSLMFTRPLDERTSIGTSLMRQNGGNEAVVDVQRNLPAGDGYGYRFQAQAGDFSRYDASVSMQNAYGRYQLDATQSQGQTSVRGDVSGGFVMFGGDTFLSRTIDQSFGVVQVPGYAHVQIYADNQPIAVTNTNGNALVPRLRAYEDNAIRIEQADLPLDAEIATLQLAAVPFLRSGVQVIFPVRRSLGALLTINLDDGKPLPAGAVVQLAGQSTEFPTGLNGEVYVTGLAPSNQITVSWRDQQCSLMVLFPPTSDPVPNLGPYLCPGVKR